MWESMNIIEQLIDNIPEGPYAVKMKPLSNCLKVNIIRELKQHVENWVYILSVMEIKILTVSNSDHRIL